MSKSKQSDVEKIAAVQAEIAELEASVGGFKEAQAVVNQNIRALHEYNEAKDACQLLIGKLATMKGTTVKQIHEDMGLLPED